MVKRAYLSLLVFCSCFVCSQETIDDVNPFIGTTNPGPIAVRGMVNVSPFNVVGPQNLLFEKDCGWLSTVYGKENKFLIGFSHVNLSGVGCSDLGVIIAMSTVGGLETSHLKHEAPRIGNGS